MRLTEAGRSLLDEEWDLAEEELHGAFATFRDDELRALGRAVALLDERTKVLARQR